MHCRLKKEKKKYTRKRNTRIIIHTKQKTLQNKQNKRHTSIICKT